MCHSIVRLPGSNDGCCDGALPHLPLLTCLQVVLAVATDVVMLLAGTLGDVLTYAPLALIFNAISWVAFPFLMHMLWRMFDG